MYLITIDHIVYEKHGGGLFTLPEAMRELHGTGNARILRADGTVVVKRAGNDYAVQHVPSGREVRRRSRMARLEDQARNAARMAEWLADRRGA